MEPDLACTAADFSVGLGPQGHVAVPHSVLNHTLVNCKELPIPAAVNKFY